MSDEYCASLRRQRDEMRETLIVITDKKLRYASPADIPSQLLKDERYWKRELAEIERQIKEHCGSVPSVKKPSDEEQAALQIVAEQEAQRREAEEAQRREAEEAQRREAEAAQQRAAEEAQQREAEAARRRAAEEAKQREAETARQRAAEEAKQHEEAKRQRAAEEAKWREAEAARQRPARSANAPVAPTPPTPVPQPNSGDAQWGARQVTPASVPAPAVPVPAPNQSGTMRWLFIGGGILLAVVALLMLFFNAQARQAAEQAAEAQQAATAQTRQAAEQAAEAQQAATAEAQQATATAQAQQATATAQARQAATATAQARQAATATAQARQAAIATAARQATAEARQAAAATAEAEQTAEAQAAAATATAQALMVEIAPGVTMELVEVPAGTFLMGSPDDDPDAEPDEKPQHELYLDTFAIGKTEVTYAQFSPFVEGDGYTNSDYWTPDGWAWREEENRTAPLDWNATRWNGDTQPVNGVTWYEAMAYAAWLSAQTGGDYRLPSEAEWEKAACGTDTRRYPWGDEPPDGERANFDQQIWVTTPVGSFPAGASPYGALDMAGNVWEWTRSVYCMDWEYCGATSFAYPYNPDDGRESSDNASPKGFTLRSGSWASNSAQMRCGARHGDRPDVRIGRLGGLRVVCAPCLR